VLKYISEFVIHFIGALHDALLGKGNALILSKDWYACSNVGQYGCEAGDVTRI